MNTRQIIYIQKKRQFFKILKEQHAFSKFYMAMTEAYAHDTKHPHDLASDYIKTILRMMNTPATMQAFTYSVKHHWQVKPNILIQP